MVTGLLKYYKDLSSHMCVEPLLSISLNRTISYSLQYISHVVICRGTTYNVIDGLPLQLYNVTEFLKIISNKQKVRVSCLE